MGLLRVVMSQLVYHFGKHTVVIDDLYQEVELQYLSTVHSSTNYVYASF